LKVIFEDKKTVDRESEALNACKEGCEVSQILSSRKSMKRI